MKANKTAAWLVLLPVLVAGFALVGARFLGSPMKGPPASQPPGRIPDALPALSRPCGPAETESPQVLSPSSAVGKAGITQAADVAEQDLQSASPATSASPKGGGDRLGIPVSQIGASRNRGETLADERDDRSVAGILDGADMANPAVREQVVAQLQSISTGRRARTEEKAASLDIPLKIITEDGRVLELQDFDGDRPLYNGTLNANAAISANVVPLRSSPYTLDGSSLTVGVWDAGSVRSSHQELAGRTTLKNASASIDNHATHVAGTIAGSGVRAAAKGMAPNTNIDSYDWNIDLVEMAAAGAASASDTARIPISNHSYGYISGYQYMEANRWRWFGNGTLAGGVEEDFGRYDSQTRDWDALAYSLPYYTIFKAAGNDRTDNPAAGDRIDDTSGGFLFNYNGASHPDGDGAYLDGYGSISFAALAKNVLTIGAVNDAVSGGQRSVGAATMSSFSSWGPADDGRIKPDLVADGVTLESAIAVGNTSYATASGTSMASPSSAGAAVLLVQLYRREFANRLPVASLLKALLIHTADDLGTAGPDYRSGWGLVNGARAAALILEHKNSSGNPRFLENQITSAASTYTHAITWDGISPIRVTLCWTDPAGLGQSVHDSRSPALVHDLDLVVTGPGGQTFRPYVMPFVGAWTKASMGLAATTGKNAVDNVEQVYIAAPPAAGIYTIRVSLDGALTRSSQSFSFVVTGGMIAGASTRVISLGGDLSFGAVPVGQSALRELAIQNLGNAPLRIEGLVLPAGFSSTWSGTIAPGAVQPVAITFLPPQAVSYSGTLQVLSDATSGMNTRSLSGTGVNAVTPLSNGVSIASLEDYQGRERFFVLAVPDGQAELQFDIRDGSGDADLYVRYGNLPTLNLWDYRPYLGGNEETVTVSNPSAGNWYVMISAYSDYSGLTLTGRYEAPGNSTKVIRLTGDLAFGNIPVGDSIVKYATVHNDGNTPIQVSGIQLPICFAGGWSGSIAPGGSQVVPVAFTPFTAQVYQGYLVVDSDKTAGDNRLPVSGNGIVDEIPLQNGVAAGPFNGQAGSMLYFFIDVPDEQSTFSVQIDGAGNQADVYLRRGEVPDLETFDYRASDGVNPQLVTVDAPASGRWHILLNGLTQYTGIRITAMFGAAPATRVIRLEGDLDFGSVRVNESATRLFSIFNDGNSPLNVSGVSYPSGYSGGGTMTVPTNQYREVTVTFAPAQEGAFNGELVVQSDATSGYSSLSVAGQGVASVSPVPMESGIPVDGIAGAVGSERFYVIAIPPGAASLEVAISGGNGDCDLYVRHGLSPAVDDWDYRPYLSGNTEGVLVEQPAAGNWYIMLHGWTAYSGVSLVANMVYPVALGEALDAQDMVWETGGSAIWLGQSTMTSDGVDAARSGSITHDQQSWMQTTVTGPGTIRFWWKVSSENNYDFLRFYIDGSQQQGISGNVDWQQRSFSVPAGTRTLRWEYGKDDIVTYGSDCGWVDQVSYTPGSLSSGIGVAFEVPIPGEFATAAKVQVRGLPPGLRYNASTRLITGVPTRTGSYTVTVSAAGVATATFAIFVEALPVWAFGNFGGAVFTDDDGPGLASMTVQSNGRITGRLLFAGATYSFAANSYHGQDGDGAYRFEALARQGRDSFPVAFTVHPPADGVVPALLSVAEGELAGGMGGLVVLLRNAWRDAGTASLLAPYVGYYTATLPGGAGYGSGYLAFTVDPRGNVRTAGRLADGTVVSCSGPLLAGQGWFGTVVYTAPRPYLGGVFFGLAEFVDEGSGVFLRSLDGDPFLWQNLNPGATGIFGDGFQRDLGLVGGWYDRLASLQAAYANGLVVEEVTLPSLLAQVTYRDLNGAGRPETLREQESISAQEEASPAGLALAVNAAGTGFVAPRSDAVPRDRVTGVYDYTADTNSDGQSNTAGLTFTFNRSTGIFSGQFKSWYDYISAHDAIRGTETWKHLSKVLKYQGILIPGREDPSDGIGGRGHYLWPERALNNSNRYYNYNRSLDFLLLDGQE